VQRDTVSLKRPIHWLINRPAYIWGWFTNKENRKPCADYSGTLSVAIIGLLGIVTTFFMADGFSNYGFDLKGEAGVHWFKVGCLVLISIGFQVLREQALKARTEAAELKSTRTQAEYERRQTEIAQKQTSLNNLTWALSASQTELNERQGELTKSQKELTAIIKTMPPAHALSTFTESYRHTLFQWRFRPKVNSDSSREEKDIAIRFLEKNIRFSLNAVAQLFLHYEHKPLDTKCSAHLTEYIPISDVVGDPQREKEGDKALERRIRAGIRFIDDKRYPFQGLKGVLHINPALSSYAEPKIKEGNIGAPDPKLTAEMFLPVPDCDDEKDDSPRSRALPIAPRAFRFGQVVYEDVQSQISKDASHNWNVTQNVVQEVLNYVDGAENGKIGSAAGYRLLWEVQSDEGERADPSNWPRIGVLTIFTESRAKMDESGVSAYFDLVRPILELQKEMLLTIVGLRA
jgi:Skp family chaperone for outer membrane proteins